MDLDQLTVGLTSGALGAAFTASIPAVVSVLKAVSDRRRARQQAQARAPQVQAVVEAEHALEETLRSVHPGTLEPDDRIRLLDALRRVELAVSKDIEEVEESPATRQDTGGADMS